MTNPKVIVLLSTYNGERFLDEQLESIFQQVGVSVEVFARDDGSTDSTLRILKKWSERNNLSFFCDGENIGPQRSFLRTLRKSPDAPFYAFADQDDVWKPDKLLQGFQGIGEVSGPALFMSTYDVVDRNLNQLFTRDMHFDVPFTIWSTLMYRCPSGCVMFFNNELKRQVGDSNPEFMRMHDFWVLLTALANRAKIVTINEPLMLYRQHENSTVGFNKGQYLMKLRRLLNSALNNNNERLRQASSFQNEFGSILSDNDNKELSRLLDYRRGFRSRLFLARNPRFQSLSWSKNVLFRISVLLGVF